MRELSIIKNLSGLREYKDDIDSSDEFDSFLNSTAYKKSISILQNKTYHGYTNEEIDKVFENV